MKKIGLFICTMLCVNLLMAQTRFMVDCLTYEVSADREVKVIDCVDTVEVVVIPSMVTFDNKDYIVTSIEGRYKNATCYYGAFRGISSLVSVTIPETVVYIGEEAFCFCEALDSIVIPKTVDSIGARAFYSCKSLRYAFVGDGVISIGIQAFQHCSRLSQLYLGQSISSIGDLAFEFCSILPSLTIPQNTSYIGDLAFAFCANLSEVVAMPATSPSIGLDVFGIDAYPDGFISDTAVLKVPCGSLQAYSSSGWNAYFARTEEMCPDAGLEDIAEPNISVYPNPTCGKLMFGFVLERIDVMDMSGKVLQTSFDTDVIDITSLPIGVYNIRLVINEKIFIKKVIKK